MTPEAVIVLDDEAVEEILRIRDVYETPWEQLAADEGVDPGRLRAAVQSWEPGQGGVIVSTQPGRGRAQPTPESRRRRAERERACRLRRIDRVIAAAQAEGAQLTRNEAVEELRAQAAAKRLEAAQRRIRYYEMAQEELNGVDVWCRRPGRQRTEEQREALYRVCALLRAEGATFAEVRGALGAPPHKYAHSLRDAYNGVTRVKSPFGGGLVGVALGALAAAAGRPSCAQCLLRHTNGEVTRDQLASALASVARRRSPLVRRVDTPCADPCHVSVPVCTVWVEVER